MSDTIAPPPPAVAVPPPAAPVAPVVVPPPDSVATPAPAVEAPKAPAWVNPWAARTAPAAEVAPVAPPKPPAPTMGDLQRQIAETTTAHAADTARASRLQAVVEQHATAELNALAPAVRAAVEKQAAGDPAAALSLITTMREAGLLNGAPAPLPVGANTAPAPSATTAPTPNTAPTPQSADALLLSQYQTLQSNAPQSAQMFRLRHGPAIERALASTVRN